MLKKNICSIVKVSMVGIYVVAVVNIVNEMKVLPSFHQDKVVETSHKTSSSSSKRPRINYIKTPNNQSLCSLAECLYHQTKRWKMVIFVKSAVGNIVRRDAIRRTWATVKSVQTGSFRTIFIVGKRHESSQLLLNEEHEKYGDILQIDEPDEYSHIAMKTLAGMQWASENLLDHDYYSTCDDDMMIKIARVQESVDYYRQVEEKEKWPEFPIICMYKIEIPAHPIRISSHKNYVSRKKYKDKFWPLACLGGMYTSRASLIKKLYDFSRTQTLFLNTDDIWITGVLRKRFGIPDFMIVAPLSVVTKHFGYVFKASSDNAIRDMLSEWQLNFNH